MRLRVAISVDHTTPATSAATATCQGRATPAHASSATEADAKQVATCPHSSTCLRFTASVITPAKAPSRNIGIVRAAETIATSSPDPVISRVNSAADSTSNQRIVLTHPPIAHRRTNTAEASRARTPPDEARTVTATLRPPSWRPFG
jgi:hypothetical protein